MSLSFTPSTWPSPGPWRRSSSPPGRRTSARATRLPVPDVVAGAVQVEHAELDGTDGEGASTGLPRRRSARSPRTGPPTWALGLQVRDQNGPYREERVEARALPRGEHRFGDSTAASIRGGRDTALVTVDMSGWPRLPLEATAARGRSVAGPRQGRSLRGRPPLGPPQQARGLDIPGLTTRSRHAMSQQPGSRQRRSALSSTLLLPGGLAGPLQPSARDLPTLGKPTGVSRSIRSR